MSSNAGFGAPLQKEARKLGNTELLDGDLVPFPGEQQWDVLASVRRIDAATIERIALQMLVTARKHATSAAVRASLR